MACRALDERGAVLLVALAALSILLALGGALLVTTTTETAIAARYRNGVQAFYAAEAAVERVMSDLRTAPDWESVAAATGGRPYVQGPLTELLASASTAPSLARIAVTVWVAWAGPGMLTIRGEARGPLGVRRRIEATVSREGHDVRVADWREGP